MIRTAILPSFVSRTPFRQVLVRSSQNSILGTASRNFHASRKTMYDDDVSPLLKYNREWAKKNKDNDPQFFQRLAEVQYPNIFWIGCADSRIPPTDVTGRKPGEIFVHRNVANLCKETDLNFMAAFKYAVENLKVKDIIICGHYNCGGVNHALTKDYISLVSEWTNQIKRLYHKNRAEIDALPVKEGQRRLSELNVQDQMRRVINSSVIQKAWFGQEGIPDQGELTEEMIADKVPRVHGWCYDPATGLAKDLKVDIKALFRDSYQFNAD
eukprot:Clim_evm47s218 gene=Clim_evmTU47s218